ncbi:hypothetical protein LCGC14_0803870 [marine sediment metagenome]|uniref:Uncharacterized protein n=1 Tax=marine sediment metagenome TaxID=412755 RepID=A0A0F9PNR1_9ZZZZ
MTYDPNTPDAADRISDTQAPIRDNFTILNDVFDEDHYNYTDASGVPPPPGFRGFHRKSTYPEEASDPTAFASLGTVYTKDNDTRTDLFYRYDSGALGNSKIFPLSAPKAFAAFNGADGTLFQAYNVASVVAAGTVWTVTFSDKLNSAGNNTDLDYVVLLSSTGESVLGTPIGLRYVSPTKNTSFVIRAIQVPTRISFVVITL